MSDKIMDINLHNDYSDNILKFNNQNKAVFVVERALASVSSTEKIQKPVSALGYRLERPKTSSHPKSRIKSGVVQQKSQLLKAGMEKPLNKHSSIPPHAFLCQKQLMNPIAQQIKSDNISSSKFKTIHLGSESNTAQLIPADLKRQFKSYIHLNFELYLAQKVDNT